MVDPGRRADHFVERWQKLDQASLRQYQAGDMSGYKAARSAMGDMARSLALQLPFCFEVRTLSDRLVSSAPE